MRRIVMAAALGALVAGSAGSAHGQFWSKIRGAAGVKLDTEYTRFDAPDTMATPSDYMVGGIELWGTAGRGLQFLGAIDLHFGGAIDGGFAYEMDLYPFGIGMQVGSFAFFGVAVGIGFSGVTSEVPFARQIPVRAMLQLNLHERVHIETYGIGKLISARARTDGTDALAGFDEVKAGALLRIGKGGEQRYQKWGNGYFLGVTYSELLGMKSYGALVGYSISLAYDPSGPYRRRRHRHRH